MIGIVKSLNEHKYEKHAAERIDIRKDNTYRPVVNQKKWTKESYTKAYMKMLTEYANR